MTRLADESARAANDAQVIDLARSWVDSSARVDAAQGLAWVVAPEVALKLVEGRQVATGSVLRNLPRTFARSVAGRTGPALTSVGPVMMASSSVQHDRVFRPIIDTLVARHGPARVSRLPRLPVAGLPRATRSATRSLAEVSASVGPLAPSDAFGAMISQSSALLARARRLFEGRGGPQLLLVATQHGAAVRALVRAALDSGTTRVVYVPHAPLANNAWYHDLPAHGALLRGQAEVAVYESVGVDGRRLHAVGDPSVPDTSYAPDDHLLTSAGSTKLLYAVSTDDIGSVCGDVEVMEAAGCDAVDVAMHPRLRDRDDLRRVFPSSWTFNPLPSTFERMRTMGPVAVVQHGSGVGLEALSLGLPLIDLCNPGRTPNYHYLRPPHVSVVSDSDELRAALRAVVRDAAAADGRRSYARRWMCRIGASAAVAICARLEEIVDEVIPQSVLLEGWQHPRSGDGGTSDGGAA